MSWKSLYTSWRRVEESILTRKIVWVPSEYRLSKRRGITTVCPNSTIPICQSQFFHLKSSELSFLKLLPKSSSAIWPKQITSYPKCNMSPLRYDDLNKLPDILNVVWVDMQHAVYLCVFMIIYNLLKGEVL